MCRLRRRNAELLPKTILLVTCENAMGFVADYGHGAVDTRSGQCYDFDMYRLRAQLYSMHINAFVVRYVELYSTVNMCMLRQHLL